jgi:glycine cleavage system pyridoxal-binding protein P
VTGLDWTWIWTIKLSNKRPQSSSTILVPQAHGDRFAEIAALAPGTPQNHRQRRSISLGVLVPPSDYSADIVVGSTQPLGVHMSCGGSARVHRDPRRGALRPRYPTLV